MERISKTITAYDKNCIAFNDKFMEFPPYIQKIEEFIDLLEPGVKVLDLGCGPGNVSRQLMLSGKKFKIEGIDLSEEMVKLARKNAPSGDFSCKDIREISFSKESYDVLILSFCIVHLSETEMLSLLQKVSTYLKEKGKLYLSFMEGKNDGFEKTSFSNEEIYYYYYHSAERVGKILKDNHLSILKVTKQDYQENDGTITTDVFIFAEKDQLSGLKYPYVMKRWYSLLLIYALILGVLIGCSNVLPTNKVDVKENIKPIESQNSNEYVNTQYGFSFSLPGSWKGYLVISSNWDGLAPEGESGETIVENGPLLSIRHPQWTSQSPRQDIPIMVFTLEQWDSLLQEKFHIGAAPVEPSEIGRNSSYVFALPARYNYAFPQGYEEVENILKSNPLQAINSK